MRHDERVRAPNRGSSQRDETPWLTTAQAGKRLGVAPNVVVNWVRVGRLAGRREQDRWRVDPDSVTAEQTKLARASWWRRADLPLGQAEGLRQAATKRLLRAAVAWRGNPSDPHLTSALIAAIDERQMLTIRVARDLKEPLTEP